jgi:hypothetical protein
MVADILSGKWNSAKTHNSFGVFTQTWNNLVYSGGQFNPVSLEQYTKLSGTGLNINGVIGTLTSINPDTGNVPPAGFVGNLYALRGTWSPGWPQSGLRVRNAYTAYFDRPANDLIVSGDSYALFAASAKFITKDAGGRPKDRVTFWNDSAPIFYQVKIATDGSFNLVAQDNSTIGLKVSQEGSVSSPGQSSASFITANQGPAFTNSNVLLGKGWGNTAAVSAAHGTSQRFTFTTAANGTGIAANPAMTINFPTKWPETPYFVCKQVGGTGTQVAVSGETTATTTTMTLKFNGTPTAGSLYTFTCIGG